MHSSYSGSCFTPSDHYSIFSKPFHPLLCKCCDSYCTFGLMQPIGDENDRGTSVEDNRSGEDVRESENGHIILSTKLGTDPFDIQECDPAKSNAMRKFLHNE
ncbi:hypothetical protein BHE74_00035273 [Ensete ventricosum]|nr:hypothetical protein GW17_00026490 [Ensete ventricosum]RWW57900.1 hypothetical protein BHE74_00035273 [Ensete ventricosum]RZR97860.1 hypothetical protein BHM03_00027104 [Ensete ventricosum]